MNKKRAAWRSLFLFVGAVLVFVLAVAGWHWHQLRKKPPSTEQLTAVTQRDYETSHQQAMADTYGGKTPQETLNLYIEALGHGDFILASKYFIGDNQAQNLAMLRSASAEGIKGIISTLKRVSVVDKSIALKEMYKREVAQYHIAESEENYIQRVGKIWEGQETMKAQVGDLDFIVRFKRYPSGIWKIVEF